MSNLGRPRTFNREKALNKAMEIFWAKGYEGATLTDLQKAMGGITAPSFYAAFGSKEAVQGSCRPLQQDSGNSDSERFNSQVHCTRVCGSVSDGDRGVFHSI